ncbi:MAG: cobyric acid synthase, partial [Myxococcota bacterium]
MKAPTLMIQGTSSSVGKSLMVTALCRLFAREGLRVAPFKSQNMSNNGAPTGLGGEIGRAQAVQAMAARVAPRVEMNPILLKPQGLSASQVVVMGRPTGVVSFREYHTRKPELRQTIVRCVDILRRDYDLVVIEGAGSPAEINLKADDIVNMFVAEVAQAPVLLVGDIDRGGVFAALVGTLVLLEPEERQRVQGLIINKFRGDRSLLEPGLEMLAQRASKPVLGVVPYLERLRIAEEDSLGRRERYRRTAPDPASGVLDVAVLDLPYLANEDDLGALLDVPNVSVRLVSHPDAWGTPDLVIVPGSKSTVADLGWLRE